MITSSLSKSMQAYRVSEKNARLRLETYNSSLEAAVGACRDIFGFPRFSAFILAQEVHDGSLRKLSLKRATLM